MPPKLLLTLRISNRGWFGAVRIVFSCRKASVGRRFCTPHVGDSSGVCPRHPVRTWKLDPTAGTYQTAELFSYPTSCPFDCQVIAWREMLQRSLDLAQPRSCQ